MTAIPPIGPNNPEAKSADIISGNIEALKAPFPDASAGSGINFEVLSSTLGAAVESVTSNSDRIGAANATWRSAPMPGSPRKSIAIAPWQSTKGSMATVWSCYKNTESNVKFVEKMELR
jgi:hypothetical protein